MLWVNSSLRHLVCYVHPEREKYLETFTKQTYTQRDNDLPERPILSLWHRFNDPQGLVAIFLLFIIFHIIYVYDYTIIVWSYMKNDKWKKYCYKSLWVSCQNENMIPNGHIIWSKRSTGYETFVLTAHRSGNSPSGCISKTYLPGCLVDMCNCNSVSLSLPGE